MEAQASERLLAWLDPDLRRAEEKLEGFERKLVKLFQWRGCPAAEDLASETLLRVLRAVAEGKVIRRADNPYAFVRGVAFNVHSEWRRRIQREAPLEDQQISDPRGWQPSSALVESVRRCFEAMTPEERELIECYFLDRDRDGLAARMNVTTNALRIRVFRTKERLRDCLRGQLDGGWMPKFLALERHLKD